MEKIFFDLAVIDEYPPVSTESLWAEQLSTGNYKVQNIPFYSKSVSFNDVVSVFSGGSNELCFKHVIRHSHNSTLRIVFFENDFIFRVLRELKNKGCSWEGVNSQFYAINIPPEVNLNKIIKYIDNISRKGVLDYEYGKLAF